MSAEHIVNQEDVQGNILCGYGNAFPHGLYLFIRFGDDQVASRSWLRELIPKVTTAEPWRPLSHKPAETLNIAFTIRGLKRLGLPKSVRRTFPDDFRHGMERRAGLLGDSGASDPSEWEPDLRNSHAVVIVMAQDDIRAKREEEHKKHLQTFGADVTYAQHAGLIRDPGAGYAREHFGFADGFSQPAIRGNAGPDTREGMGTPTAHGWEEVAPGEFVLGYPGEDGLLPYAPAPPLGDGGSYLVLRKLHQDVAAFRSYLRSVAKERVGFLDRDPPTPTDPDYDELLLARGEAIAAKMVGRWQDGRSLVTSREPTVPSDDPALDPSRINGFRYREYEGRTIDPIGARCPLGSHVRRANPRDSLGWDGLLTKRHRIIRRGMPYGEPAPGRGTDVEPADRGLMFACYQTSIERQFELIQSRWLNDGDAFWLGREKDCLSMGSRMTVQGDREPTYLPAPKKPFINTRGGDYFFVPGLPALRALGSGYWR